MTPEEKSVIASKYIKRLKEEIDNPDTEEAHVNADGILSDLLIDLGFEVVVNEYDAVNKWYA